MYTNHRWDIHNFFIEKIPNCNTASDEICSIVGSKYKDIPVISLFMDILSFISNPTGRKKNKIKGYEYTCKYVGTFSII